MPAWKRKLFQSFGKSRLLTTKFYLSSFCGRLISRDRWLTLIKTMFSKYLSITDEASQVFGSKRLATLSFFQSIPSFRFQSHLRLWSLPLFRGLFLKSCKILSSLPDCTHSLHQIYGFQGKFLFIMPLVGSKPRLLPCIYLHTLLLWQESPSL